MYAEVSKNPNPAEIDPKVRTLVKALNDMGLTTYSSCEGHEPRVPPFQWSHPHVTIVLDDSDTDAFIRLSKHLCSHNHNVADALKGEHVRWQLLPRSSAIDYLIDLMPHMDPPLTLEQMQAGAEKLATNLQTLEWNLQREERAAKARKISAF